MNSNDIQQIDKDEENDEITSLLENRPTSNRSKRNSFSHKWNSKNRSILTNQLHLIMNDTRGRLSQNASIIILLVIRVSIENDKIKALII